MYRLNRMLRTSLLVFLLILSTLFSVLFLKPYSPALAASCVASVATVTQTSSPVFYIDTGYTHGYVSYKVTTGASQSFSDLWVKVDTFSSGNLALASSEDGLYRVGAVSGGSNATAYFYLQGAATNTVQTYTVRLYEGKPGSGGSETCNSAQSNTSVVSTIQASANKVTSVNYTAPTLGGNFTVTIIGDSGTIGGTNEFAYTPATQAGWSADCLELQNTSIILSGGNTGTYNNGLYLSGLNSSATHYVLNYTFKAKCVTASSTAVNPLSYISSGGSLKHTSTANYGSLPPIAPATNSVTLNKSVSPAYSTSGGVATYSVDITNSGAFSSSLDDIVDTLPSSPANASYVTNSATFDDDISGGAAASSISNPTISGQALTWTRLFTIASGKTGRLTYQVNIPSTTGSYTNSVVGHIGTTQIDKTVLTTDSVPATTTYGVGSISLSSSTKTAVDINGGTLQPGDIVDYTIDIIAQGSGTATGVAVSDTIDSDMNNLTNIIVGANGTECGDAFVNSSTSTTVNITNMQIVTGSHCLITYKATVKSSTTNGTAILNTASISLTNPGGIGASPSSAPMTVQKTPTLTISITDNDSDNVVIANQVVTYTVTINNTGQADANGVDLVSTITGPAGALGTPTLSNCGNVAVDTSVLPTVNLAGLAITMGTPCVITYTVTVSSGATSGQIDNSTDITAAREGGNNPSAVTASSLLIGAAPTPPNLSGTITENDADNLVEPGQKVTYTLTITNSGQTDATTSAVVSVDPLYQTPTNKIYTNCGSPSSSYVAPNLSFTSLSVLAGATCTITYDVTLASVINEGVTIEEVLDIATASQGGNNPSPIDAQVLTVNATPVLAVTKTSDVSGSSVTANQAIVYTITISNSGNGNATGVSINDIITGDISTVGNFSYTNCGASYSNTSSGLNVTITGLVITTTNSCVVRYTATVMSNPTFGSSISNTAEISSSAEGSNIPPAVSVGPYSVVVLPLLAVTKSENDADNSVTIGQTITYTIAISNSSSASGTTSFTDVISSAYSAPSNIQFSHCGASPSSSFVGSTLSGSNLAVTNSNNCVISYDVVVQNSATNGQSLSNSVDVAAPSEGGNNPAPVSSDNVVVSAVPTLETSTHTVSDVNGGNVVPGDTLLYTITVINTGNGTGTGITVSNNIDSDIYDITDVQFSNCGSPVNSSTSTVLNISNITTTTSTNCVITYNVKVKSPSVEGTQILSTATISASSEGGLGATPFAATQTIDVTPNIAISTTSNPVAGNVVRNQTITYTTTISNTGNGPGTLDLTGTITGPVSNISNIQFSGCGASLTNSTSGLSLDITSLSVSTTANCVITYEVTVNALASDGSQITNQTDVSQSSEGGNDPSPTAIITHTVVLPNLAVTKTENDSDNTVELGQTIHYEITIQNTSAVSATTSLVDSIPSGFNSPTNITFSGCGSSKSVDSTSPTLNISSIEVSANSSCVVSYDVTVKNNATNGSTLTNSVDVAPASEGGDDPGVVSASTLTVDATPQISISTTSSPAPGNVVRNQTITYTTTISNTGKGPGTIDLAGAITGPVSNISNIQFSGCGSSYVNSTSGDNLNITDLTVSLGTNCVVTYEVTVNSSASDGSTVSNTTDVSAPSEGGNDPSPTSAINHTVVLPNLVVTKTEDDSDNTVGLGQSVHYIITIQNTSAVIATTSLVDTIPSGFNGPTNISFSGCGSSKTINSSSPTLSISSIVINANTSCLVSYDLTVKNNATNGSTLTNSVDVSAANEGGNDPGVVSASTLTVDATPHILINTTSSPNAGSVLIGTIITYTTTITNDGNGPATLDLTGLITGPVSNISNVTLSNCGGSFVNSTSGLNLNISNLSITNGTSCTITYQVTVSPTANDGDEISVTTDATAPVEGGSDPSPTPALKHQVTLAELLVSLIDDDSDNIVSRNQEVTYTTTITNTSSTKATTSLINTLSSGLSSPFSIVLNGCGSSTSSTIVNQTYSLTNIEIDPLTSCTITYKTTVNANLADGDLLSNVVDVAKPTEGGNDPGIISADVLKVSVPIVGQTLITTIPGPTTKKTDPTTSTEPTNPETKPTEEIIVAEVKKETLEPTIGLVEWINKTLPEPVKYGVRAIVITTATVTAGWAVFNYGLIASAGLRRF